MNHGALLCDPTAASIDECYLRSSGELFPFTLVLGVVMSGASGSEVLTVTIWLGISVLLSFAVIGWLNLSRSKWAQNWRARAADSRQAIDPSEDSYPHMHVVDGVTITHSHADGQRDHEHTTITVSMKHYAQLVKRAQRRQSS